MKKATVKEADIPSEQQMEEGNYNSKDYLPNLPTPLTNEEKKYLLAVERGDVSTVRRMLQKSHRYVGYINKNCVDPLGRGALLMAIDNECLEMLELLLVMSVNTKDALLHAIDKEFVEGVEVLLEHEEVIHKDGEPYSWEKVDWHTSSFTLDITPLILAAHRDNYEILKILLDRGAVLPMPHDIRCACEECLKSFSKDSLNHSMSRINSYRALASPSLIALSSTDPILTAFELSWELKNLAYAENEFRMEYMNLRRQCKNFAEELLNHTRSSNELAIILNHDPKAPPYIDGEHMKLARLELAIEYKQKKFVSHPNVQQLLGAIWYEGLPGFKRKPLTKKLLEISKVALLFPLYCTYYMIFPNSDLGKCMRTPFMKFLIHSSSYLFFLLLLILHSVRFDQLIVYMIGSENMIRKLQESSRQQRGNLPTPIEIIVVLYVFGFLYEEMREIQRLGFRRYLANMWNIMDIMRDSLYMFSTVLRVIAYMQQQSEIKLDPQIAYLPRQNWNAYDPELISEGLFAAANILSGLKLVHIFSINPYLGPLQISLGRMVIDIVKFFFIYSLVLFAFACGLTQLLWYFNDLEKQKCYSLPGNMPDWTKQGDSCMKWRRFHNVFEASQSLFWAGFGMVGLSDFELTGIREYTRFWSMLMFGTYSVINIIVLLNLLIAMMSNSYSFIVEHADSEWKFARTKLWMSYFDDGGTLPPPFNIFPNMKLIYKFTGQQSKDKSFSRMSTRTEKRKRKDRDYRYLGVMRAIIWRYVCSLQQRREERAITEDDVNEVKGDISSLRYELVDLFESNGMDVSVCSKRKKAALGRKMRIWERRLMRDFYVCPAMGKETSSSTLEEEKPPSDLNALDRFRRIAKLAIVTNLATSKKGDVSSSQIGRMDMNDDTRKETLKEAIENARRKMQEGIVDSSPGSSRGCSPYPDLYTGPNLLDAVRSLELSSAASPVMEPLPNGTFLKQRKKSNNLEVPCSTGQKSSPQKPKNILSEIKNVVYKSKREEKSADKPRTPLTTVTTETECPPYPKPEKRSPPADIMIDFRDTHQVNIPINESKQRSSLILEPLVNEYGSKVPVGSSKKPLPPPVKKMESNVGQLQKPLLFDEKEKKDNVPNAKSEKTPLKPSVLRIDPPPYSETPNQTGLKAVGEPTSRPSQVPSKIKADASKTELEKKLEIAPCKSLSQEPVKNLVKGIPTHAYSTVPSKPSQAAANQKTEALIHEKNLKEDKFEGVKLARTKFEAAPKEITHKKTEDSEEKPNNIKREEIPKKEDDKLNRIDVATDNSKNLVKDDPSKKMEPKIGEPKEKTENCKQISEEKTNDSILVPKKVDSTPKEEDNNTGRNTSPKSNNEGTIPKEGKKNWL